MIVDYAIVAGTFVDVDRNIEFAFDSGIPWFEDFSNLLFPHLGWISLICVLCVDQIVRHVDAGIIYSCASEGWSLNDFVDAKNAFQRVIVKFSSTEV